MNADAHNNPAIDNVKNAIIWVGMKNIQDWLMLMLYAHLDTQTAPAV